MDWRFAPDSATTGGYIGYMFANAVNGVVARSGEATTEGGGRAPLIRSIPRNLWEGEVGEAGGN